MASKSDTAASIYVAKEAFLLHGDQLVPAGATVAAGHPLLRKREHLFEPFKPMFDLEPEPTSSAGAGALAVRQALVARAKALGLSASGKSAELEAAVASAEAEQAAAEQAAAAKAAAEAQGGSTADAGGDA